jgi:hydroxyacylglutathione hydrolase/adenylyltransferase/sulfurtransferase
VDVREPYEWEAGRIAGARHIELERLASEAETIDRERPVVFYCRLGARSGMAASAFRGAGYQAFSMAGGISAWDEQGNPLEPGDGSVADH